MTSEMRTSAGRPRLPEIDHFRATAICLMGAGHALNWVSRSDGWVAALGYISKFYCFAAFLMAFAMSMAVSYRRADADSNRRRRRTLYRAATVLIAYYVVAFGRHGMELLHAGARDQVSAAARLLLLIDVPKAGDFLLCFLAILVAAAVWPRIVAYSLSRPSPALLWSFGSYIAACALAAAGPPSGFPSGWWKLLFGGATNPRTFPVFAYAPVFVAGLLLGRAYVGTENPSRDVARWAKGAVLIGAATIAVSLTMTGRLQAAALSMSPVPGPLYLALSGVVSVLVFLTCAMASRYITGEHTRRPASVALSFVGQNPISIIVCQYLWIQIVARSGHIALASNGAVAAFALSMVVVPPVLVWALRQAIRRVTPRSQSVPGFATEVRESPALLHRETLDCGRMP